MTLKAGKQMDYFEEFVKKNEKIKLYAGTSENMLILASRKKGSENLTLRTISRKG